MIDRVVVVCPTDHLRTQWADAAGRAGIALDPHADQRGRAGAAGPDRLRHDLRAGGGQAGAARGAGGGQAHAGGPRRGAPRRRRAVAGARRSPRRSSAAARRLCLTGTPVPDPGRRAHPVRPLRAATARAASRSSADFTYGYREALRDGVVRPVVFAAYTGTSRWRNSAGEVVAASLSEAAHQEHRGGPPGGPRSNPQGQWVPHVIAAMDERITHLRESGMPDAAGLVLASDQDDARAYAEIVEQVTGYTARR